MKKILLTFALFIISIALAGCGGGTGTSSQPSGVNQGVASVIQLIPMQSVVQTNSHVLMKAKVLDGNGDLLAGVPVTFTNLSLIGSLSGTTATTDQLGIATVSLFSTTTGFSTVQAEVNTGAGMVRDKRTVFFSDYDIALAPPSANLTLDVDGNNNNIFNESSDLILFQNPDDNEVLARATLTYGGVPVMGDLILFGADTTDATFPLGDTATTNSDGQASVLIKVDPSVLTKFNTVLNIYASDLYYGAFDVVSLFLKPVLVDTVSVTSDPQVVDSGGTTSISAQVLTTAGNAAPDGTAVSFSASDGSVTPFGQTTGGEAGATFTAPVLDAGSSPQTVTVTATSGGKSGSVNVTVAAPTPTPTPAPELQVTPSSISVLSESTSQNLQFTITGGTPPYVTTSTDPSIAYNGTLGNGLWSDLSSLTVTIPAYAGAGSATLNITDADGNSTTAKINILAGAPDYYLRPVGVTINAGQSVTYTIFGGTAPYAIYTDHPGDISINYPGGNTFTVTGGNAVTAIITVRDSEGRETTTTLTVK